ncbi:MAG: hypothetical protein AAGJ95_05285 [Cyanobacteria bacterium J06554_11]
MVEQRSLQELSPQLRAVLGSLDVGLEAELLRYRRNRYLDNQDDDLFAALDEPVFEEEPVLPVPIVDAAASIPLAIGPVTPPPLPLNKKLLAEGIDSSKAERLQLAGASQIAASGPSFTGQTHEPHPEMQDVHISSVEIPDSLPGHLVRPLSGAAPRASLGAESHSADDASDGAIARTSYLASSEKLIESLAEVPPLPDPVDHSVGSGRKPKRKTVSLLAGATLGFVGLVAGLGASYLMANPGLTQRLAGRFRQPNLETASQSIRDFDPPGPDLSASEFIDLEIDNLSSLTMPPAVIVPTGAAAPPVPSALPPVEPAGSSAGSSAPNATLLPPLPAGSAPNNLPTTPPASSNLPAGNPLSNRAAPPTAPVSGSAIAPIETQAVVMPVGLTYYVTVPFTTQQRLLDIRESVSEAFVRRFADGNRIQMAAFDNPQAAQQFIAVLESKDITAQIYGPTTE